MDGEGDLTGSNPNSIEESKQPDIRYVPVEIKALEEEGESVSFVDVFRQFYDQRKTIYKTISIFVVLGIFIALVSVEEYSSQVQILPETAEELNLGSLGGIAEQFGIAGFQQNSTQQISARLYPSIVNSNVFLEELMRYQIVLPESGEQVTVNEYFREHQEFSILKFTVMLPFTIKKWVTGLGRNTISDVDRMVGDNEKLERLTRMSGEEWEILRNLRDRIATTLDSETGTVSVVVKMQDPVVAADLADEVVQMLSEYITEQRTEKARRNVKFMEERYNEAKQRFEEAQMALATFNDENRGQLTASARTEEQMLQSRYNLNFNIYNTIAERLEQARIKLQEETPVISIIEPASVPDRRSEPNRTLIVFFSLLMGGITGICIVFFQRSWHTFRSEILSE